MLILLLLFPVRGPVDFSFILFVLYIVWLCTCFFPSYLRCILTTPHKLMQPTPTSHFACHLILVFSLTSLGFLLFRTVEQSYRKSRARDVVDPTANTNLARQIETDRTWRILIDLFDVDQGQKAFINDRWSMINAITATQLSLTSKDKINPSPPFTSFLSFLSFHFFFLSFFLHSFPTLFPPSFPSLSLLSIFFFFLALAPIVLLLWRGQRTSC